MKGLPFHKAMGFDRRVRAFRPKYANAVTESCKEGSLAPDYVSGTRLFGFVLIMAYSSKSKKDFGATPK